MVKGISRQVIVVESPGPELFEQAIFILKDKALGEGITQERLLKEAQQVIRSGRGEGKRPAFWYGAAWAVAGAMATGIAWLLTVLF